MMVVDDCDRTPYHIHHMITYRPSSILLSIFPTRIVFCFFALLNCCFGSLFNAEIQTLVYPIIPLSTPSMCGCQLPIVLPFECTQNLVQPSTQSRTPTGHRRQSNTKPNQDRYPTSLRRHDITKRTVSQQTV